LAQEVIVPVPGQTTNVPTNDPFTTTRTTTTTTTTTTAEAINPDQQQDTTATSHLQIDNNNNNNNINNSPIVKDQDTTTAAAAATTTVNGASNTVFPTTKTCAYAAIRAIKPPKYGDNNNNNNNNSKRPSTAAMPLHPDAEQYVCDQLNIMGTMAAGSTYWPFDWEIIQRAAQQIPQRLHQKTIWVHEKHDFNVQLIPKSTQAEQQQQTQQQDITSSSCVHQEDAANNNSSNSDNESDDETLLASNVQPRSSIVQTATTATATATATPVDHPTMPPPPLGGAVNSNKNKNVVSSSLPDETEQLLQILKRKNSLRGDRRSDNYHHHQHHQKRQKLDELYDADEMPRPACPPALETRNIPWNSYVSQQMANPELDALVELDPDETTSTTTTTTTTSEDNPRGTLLGALKILGHVHHVLQMPEDYSPHELESMDDKQCRKKFQLSFRERLGPHQLEKDPKEHNVKTRIKHCLAPLARPGPVISGSTRDRLGITTNDTVQHWWDMDLGECIFDLASDREKTDDGKQAVRRLYAFSSVECFLLDENNDPQFFEALNRNGEKIAKAAREASPPLLVDRASMEVSEGNSNGASVV